eukprot:3276193-Rhodomonas_salina.2
MRIGLLLVAAGRAYGALSGLHGARQKFADREPWGSRAELKASPPPYRGSKPADVGCGGGGENPCAGNPVGGMGLDNWPKRPITCFSICPCLARPWAVEVDGNMTSFGREQGDEISPAQVSIPVQPSNVNAGIAWFPKRLQVLSDGHFP